MWTKIEVAAVSVGTMAALVLWVNLLYGYEHWPKAHRLIFYSSPVSSALGYLLIVGAGGSVLFVTNLLFKRQALWPLRLGMIVTGYWLVWIMATSVT